MINKVFLAIVAVAAAVTGTLCYYAYSWLSSIGDPAIASERYVSNSTLSWTLLWVSFAALAVVALVSLWQSRSKWPLWIAFAYFALFSLLLMLNDAAYSGFLERNSLETEHTLLNPFLIAVLLVVLLIGVLALQILTVNVRVKVKKEGEAGQTEPGSDNGAGESESEEADAKNEK